MKANSAKKRILALLTAPSLLLSVPHVGALPRADGAVFDVMHQAEDALPWDAFLADTFFFGESTTAHLARNNGVLDTPTLRRHVWKDESGTRMLDGRTSTSIVNYIDENGAQRPLSFEEALLCEQPRRLILSFGLNGILFFQKNTDLFIKDYERLIRRVKELSPVTHVLIQSIYPIRRADAFGCDSETLNRYIGRLNQQLLDFSKAHEGVTFVDTASVLRDGTGALREEFDAGDGIHLTNDAYFYILSFLASHENNLPKGAHT